MARGQLVLLCFGVWAALATSGCAPARRLSPHMLDPDGNPPSTCAPKRYIVATASSSRGQGDAERLARAEVARRISSSLEASSESFEADASVNGRSTTERRAATQVLERTAFSHSELIRMVGPAEEVDGQTHVLVCLDRNEAAARLQADLEPELRAVAAAVARAEAAAAAKDCSAFAGTWRDVVGPWSRALPLLNQCRAISGRPCDAEVRLRRDRERLSEEAARFRSSIVYGLHVQPSDFPDEARASVSDSFHRALTTLGPTRADVASCQAAQPGTIWVEVAPSANCGWGSLGHTCRPEYRIRAHHCAGNAKAVESSVAGNDLSAADPRDAKRALRKAVALLTPERARAALQDALSAIVPF